MTFAILTARAEGVSLLFIVRDSAVRPICLPTDHFRREANNRALGTAGELFILNDERARLTHAGYESLAVRLEHTSRVRGDHESYDISSFESTGAWRLIAIKTTRYGRDTPFYATQNEIVVSEANRGPYPLYRLFHFADRRRRTRSLVPFRHCVN